MVKNNLKYHTYFAICLVIALAYHTEAFCDNQSQTQAIDSSMQKLIFYKQSVKKAYIIDSVKKSCLVRIIDSDISNQQIKIPTKYVFDTRNANETIGREVLRFVYYDNSITDNVVLKGTVLGYNTTYFLIEIEFNNKIYQKPIHQSAIVRKDLKP